MDQAGLVSIDEQSHFEVCPFLGRVIGSEFALGDQCYDKASHPADSNPVPYLHVKITVEASN